MIAFIMGQPLSQPDDLTKVCWFSQFSWRDSVIGQSIDSVIGQCIDSVMYRWVEVTVILKTITVTNFTLVQNALSGCLWDCSGLSSYFLNDIWNSMLVIDKGLEPMEFLGYHS